MELPGLYATPRRSDVALLASTITSQVSESSFLPK